MSAIKVSAMLCATSTRLLHCRDSLLQVLYEASLKLAMAIES